MTKLYDSYAEALSRDPDGPDGGKCILVRGEEEKVIDCSNVGFDSKKAKKIIAPSDTKVSFLPRRARSARKTRHLLGQSGAILLWASIVSEGEDLETFS